MNKPIDSSNNILGIEELRIKKLIEKNRGIREADTYFEYCKIKEYEELYEDFHCVGIQLEEVTINFLTTKNTRFLCSLIFPKENYDLKKMVQWLHFNDVIALKKGENTVQKAHSMLDGFLFEGTPVVIYKKGNSNISVDIETFSEITEIFVPVEKRMDTLNTKEITSSDNTMKITLNGEKIDYIPEIELDLTKDLLISNGNLIVAEYIGEYCGCIGFFEQKGDSLPVAWLLDKESNIIIDIYEKDDNKIVVVEYAYAIDIDTLF